MSRVNSMRELLLLLLGFPGQSLTDFESAVCGRRFSNSAKWWGRSSLPFDGLSAAVFHTADNMGGD